MSLECTRAAKRDTLKQFGVDNEHLYYITDADRESASRLDVGKLLEEARELLAEKENASASQSSHD
ncbi:hypothetical protein [Neptuniibacter sp. QD37_11]|uniref:hypothetical protein n=1 Tax=Neptuniibacter sp. QD37_11 TaxID=3398209 RepID=UPI0039F56386